MKIETIEIAGIEGALTALRLPYGKDTRSNIRHETTVHIDISDMDCERNPDAWDITLKGYRVCKSYSDITIDERDMTLMSTLVKRGDEHAKVVRGIMVWAKITAPVYWWCEEETYRAGHERLASESTMHIDCKGLSGEDLVKAKAEIPMGKELTKVDMFSYQCLRNMVRQRHNHRLPEWHTFIEWVKGLPFAEELIFVGLNLEE